ncbi:MAG TPA: mercury(II) reductase, partial [Devosia sp.]|nr:mercury(II) reductase [Devosia sp.]
MSTPSKYETRISENQHWDICVVGAGSAGFSAAITAADAGAKVLLIGFGTIGGTCVNVGCVPSKALMRAVEPVFLASASARFAGVQAQAQISDWAALNQQKQDLVDQLRQAKYIDVLPGYDNVSYVQGEARFAKNGVLQVDGTDIRTDKIILATGAHAATPDISNIENTSFLTSTSALELEELPVSMTIVGAGYIGVEIAQIFSRAGVEVNLVSRRGLLPEGEPEISEALSGYFREEGINLHRVKSYEHVEENGDEFLLHVRGETGLETIGAQKLMLATGRAANTKGLNLMDGGVHMRPNGSIIVDAQMCTSREDVYAAGDVTGQDQFVYMAAYGAKIAAKNALNNGALRYDNSIMPSVVFCDPQVADVGLSEAKAAAKGIEVKTSIFTLDNLPRALAARDTRG